MILFEMVGYRTCLTNNMVHKEASRYFIVYREASLFYQKNIKVPTSAS